MTDTLPNLAEHFNVATHNGKITIKNRATGQWKTFKIHTQKKDASFAPGERIVSLLTGPDNENSYKGFGFVKPDGSIILWKKARTPAFRAFASLLRHTRHGQAAQTETAPNGYEYLYKGRCRCCNRTLTTPDSVRLGIGPVCRGE